jgi:hypothetical protein
MLVYLTTPSHTTNSINFLLVSACLSSCLRVYQLSRTANENFTDNIAMKCHSFYKIVIRPKRDEVTGEWRRLHNKKLYALNSSLNIIRLIKSRRLRWAGQVARMGERRGAYRALVGKPVVRRPLGRPRRRWEDNIKMDLQEVGLGS